MEPSVRASARDIMPARKPLPRGLSLARVEQAEELRVLAQSFPSPSDKMLSPISRALAGGKKKKQIFGDQARASVNTSSLATGSAGHHSTLPARSMMARKACRQAFLSGSKLEPTQSRLDADNIDQLADHLVDDRSGNDASPDQASGEQGSAESSTSGTPSKAGNCPATRLFSSPEQSTVDPESSLLPPDGRKHFFGRDPVGADRVGESSATPLRLSPRANAGQ